MPASPRRAGWIITAMVLLVAAGGGLALWSWGGKPRQAPLSVLLITLDTTRADYLGCFGRTPSPTPNIDRAAAEGLVFERCTSCSPLTLPSHCSILTSLYPYAHGARLNGTGRLAPSVVTLAETLRDQGLATRAAVASFVLNQQFGTDQGFEVYHDVPPAAERGYFQPERKADVVCDDALKLLDDVAGRRFFLWAHFYDPHHPYVARPAAGAAADARSDIDSPQAYEREVAYMDAQIGRLLRRLSELGRDRDTLVILVGDHGEGLGEHDELTHGHFVYETTTHVPLILRCPGVVPGGRRVAAQVRTIDIAPTVLALTGAPAWAHAQGESLAPLFATAADPGWTAYSESLMQVEYGLSPLRSLTEQGWKYILAPQRELYDLAGDAGETRNVHGDEPDRAGELHGTLHDLIADAPEPPSPDECFVDLSAAGQQLLESLGYVAGARPSAPEPEIARFEPVGRDPKDVARTLSRINRDLVRLTQANDNVAAEQLARELLEQMPDCPKLHVLLGDALTGRGLTEAAVAEFERAIELAPHDLEQRRKYGLSLIGVGRLEAGLAELNAVLLQLPDDTRSLLNSAKALGLLERYDEAAQRLEHLLEIEPRTAEALRVLAVVREKQMRLADALKCINDALALENHPEWVQDRQRMLKRMGLLSGP